MTLPAAAASAPAGPPTVTAPARPGGVPDQAQAPLRPSWGTPAWAIQHTPNPAGSHGSVLSGVSCASARACTAVGSYSNGTTGLTLAERWRG